MTRHLPLVLVLALAGCGAPLPSTPMTPPTAEEQAAFDAILDVSNASREAFDQQVLGNPEAVEPSYHTLATLAEPPQATVVAGCYAGPFPAGGALPGDYKVRPAGDWLKLNPAIRSSGEGLGVTSTYWTPNGTTRASAAQTIEARVGDTVIQDLYVSPNTTVSDLPAFFKDKLALPAQYQVLQAEETYKVYNNGALSGPANGYRWLVLDGEKQSWVRALRVQRADGTAATHYNVSSSYADLNGSLTPLHTAYATQLEGSSIGYGIQRDTDLATGKVKAKGTWTDLKTNATLALDETTEADGTITRHLTRTLEFGETLELIENYKAHGKAGTGSVKINDISVGTLSWNSSYKGTMTIASASLPYVASRAAAAQRNASLGISMRTAITDYPSPPPSPAPTVAPTAAPTATPSDAPSAAPTATPTPCPTPTPWLRSPSLSPLTQARNNIRLPWERR